MSLTVQQLLNDAKRLSNRLREHDASADNVISSTQSVLKEMEAMRQYQEDIDSLNSIAHNRPRAQLVLGIQQENRHIRQLQHENKELKAALEEHQNAIELIMSKYREHMACLVNSTKIDSNFINQQKTVLLQDRADKICEMASVMQRSMQIDEVNQAREQELMSRLITENKGLREMLEISFRNGSYSDPLVGPKMVTRAIQTEPPTATASANSSSLSPSASSTAVDKTSGVKIYGYSQTSRTEENHENGRPLSSLNGTALSTPNSASNESLRPLSSASEESEETSSISDDDEIIFNTIRRQVKKPDVMSIFGLKNVDKVSCNVEQKADAFLQNNFEQKGDTYVEHLSNCDDVNECDAENDESSAVKNDVTLTETSKLESTTKVDETSSSENSVAEGATTLVKVNGDNNHLSDNLMDKPQQQHVLSQS